jgi:hypothetical protein
MFPFVPLQMNFMIDDKKCIIWQNPRSYLTGFCQPIKFLFKKNTAEYTCGEVKNIETQIET